ncbi:hypothetical protein EXS65_00265 [Candidatus Peribacteria bacterium]|nr:hypothetical protein [Candidatus Peribacteria bacterium]
MTKVLQKRLMIGLACALLVLLCIKYFWSLLLFPGVPFGYDAGMYRYLFIKHAEAFPPFSVTQLPPWAESHPLGLFFFSTVLMRAGVPVDSLIGWVWNLFPVILSTVLAIVFARKKGIHLGILILVVSLLSTVQYQGFLMMYWKVFAAFFCCILAFDARERQSRMWVFFGMLTIAIHQQIGLIFALAVFSSLLSSAHRRKTLVQGIGWLALSLVLGLLWYLPNFTHALSDLWPLLRVSASSTVTLGVVLFVLGALFIFTVVPKYGHRILLIACGVIGIVLLLLPHTGIAPGFLSHLTKTDVVPGSFLTIPEYLELSLPMLLLGIFGLMHSLKKEKGTVWQWAVLWSALAVCSMFFFYRRFLLPLDFFLLPFSALALHAMWTNRDHRYRLLCGAFVFMQGFLVFRQIGTIDPHVDRRMLQEFSELHRVIEPVSQVIVLDVMAPWIVGYLPQNAVSGPGIFDSQPLSAWERFLYGTAEERQTFISHYPKGTYFYATDVFRVYYPPEVQTLFTHPCLERLEALGLYRSTCGV